MPSKDELNLMYLNIGPGDALGLGNIGGFTSADYWSSTEIDSTDSWKQVLDSGYQGFNEKYGLISLRAIRAF